MATPAPRARCTKCGTLEVPDRTLIACPQNCGAARYCVRPCLPCSLLCFDAPFQSASCKAQHRPQHRPLCQSISAGDRREFPEIICQDDLVDVLDRFSENAVYYRYKLAQRTWQPSYGHDLLARVFPAPVECPVTQLLGITLVIHSHAMGPEGELRPLSSDVYRPGPRSPITFSESIDIASPYRPSSLLMLNLDTCLPLDGYVANLSDRRFLKRLP